ncbi:hypothetical protein L7F22_054789 [Adiantum nelumboides]|nr:hypothetical protein [Adiantum nelumboides]
MRKQNDKEDPLEDAIEKCKEEMQETINKINRNLLSTIKTLEDRVTAQDEEIARLKQELEVHSKNALEEGDCQPSVMEDHGVQALREDLRAEVQALREEVSTLKRELMELAEAKERGFLEDGEIQPSMIDELNIIRAQVKEMEEEGAKKTSWVEALSKTQKKVEEAEKWIEVVKKGKGKDIPTTTTPDVINKTLEEEQRRRVRALHVRVTGLKDSNKVDQEVKSLMSMMGVEKPLHTGAWRVGRKNEGNGESSKKRALILRFPSMEEKKGFLKKRPLFKKTGNYLIAITLTTSRTNFISPLELQIFNHDGMKAETDEELVEGPSRVSLLCPISHKRITSPVKGVSCKHHQCFDYNTFMEINSRRPSWRCPYCNRNVSFPDLRLDLQMLKILKESDDTAVDVMVLEDGSWKMLSNEVMQTSSTPKRDGSSPNLSGDTSAEEGEFRLEKNNPNYIELSDTEDQDRQNQESAQHSFAGVSLGGSGGGQPLEDRKPDVREINLAMATASAPAPAPAGQTETAGDGLLATTSGEQLTAVAQSSNNMLQPLANEGGPSISEGIIDRQVNREISRSPIAIQALPAQTGTTNSSLRVRPRTSSQPNSPAHPNSGVYSATPNGQLATNQRHLQVQLPSFVGIQDGQVLLNMGQPQQVQIEVPELLTNTPSLQGGELRDYRQRAGPHAHQQRTVTTQTFSTQPVAQASPRASRDHPYHPGSRSLNQVRVDRQIGQQQTSVQQLVRPDSPSLPDPNQFWQQVRLVQPTQHQLQGHLSIGSNISREEFVSPGLPSIAEGIPMFNQSVGGSGAVANTFRRQTSQTTRTVPGQYLQSINNPLIVSNSNVFARDQRWSSLDGISGLVDASNTQLSEQVQRAATRMRGSVTLPVMRDTSMASSVPPANTQWMHGSSSQPSRFSPGVSLSGWNSDAVRHSDPSRSSTATGMNLQSIQTASTLVSDFDNWFDTHNDSYLAYQGLGDFGDMRPG